MRTLCYGSPDVMPLFRVLTQAHDYRGICGQMMLHTWAVAMADCAGSTNIC